MTRSVDATSITRSRRSIRGPQLATFYTPLVVPYHLVTLAEFHTFSPNVGNEFRVGFNRKAKDYTVPSGLTFPGQDAFPNLTIDDLKLHQRGSGSERSAVRGAEHVSTRRQRVVGRKETTACKFGVDLRKQIDPQLFIQRSRGDYEW